MVGSRKDNGKDSNITMTIGQKREFGTTRLRKDEGLWLKIRHHKIWIQVR